MGDSSLLHVDLVQVSKNFFYFSHVNSFHLHDNKEKGGEPKCQHQNIS